MTFRCGGVLRAVFFLLLACGLTFAQNPPDQQGPGRGPGGRGEGRGGGMGMMMMGGSMGEVTALSGDSVTVKTMSGESLTIKTTADTRIFGKDRTPISLKDIKVGDFVAAGGAPPTDGVVQARFMGVLDETARQRMAEFQANLGKTVIAGQVQAISDTRLTIKRPDGQTQDIELDESTSLRRGRDESITLADVKVGDRVMGQGSVKSGVFVPTELRVMQPGMRRQGQAGPPPNGSTSAPTEPPRN
jgi:preprotein translocase subunit YajC